MAAAQDLDKAAHEPFWEPWKAGADLLHAAEEGARALDDEGHFLAAFGDYMRLEGEALGLQALAALERGFASAAELAAKGAATTARALAGLASDAEAAAAALGATASRDRAAAAAAVANAAALTARAAAAAKAKKAAPKAAPRGKAKAKAGRPADYSPFQCARFGTACAPHVTPGGGAKLNPPDYYTLGGQVCLILCVGLSMTIDRYGRGYLTPSLGTGVGGSVGFQPGFIDNASPKYHTKDAVAGFIKGLSGSLGAGFGPASVTLDNGDFGQTHRKDVAVEPGLGTGLSFGASATFSYSIPLGKWDGKISGNAPPEVCSHLGVCN
jgi:hypothetical protein